MSIINFSSFYESQKNYFFEFEFGGKKYNFQGNVLKETVGPVVDFLYENGYKFEGPLHTSFSKKLVTMDEIIQSSWASRIKKGQFYNLKKTDKYIGIGSNILPTLEFVKLMLVNFGVDESTIKWSGFQTGPTVDEDDLTLVDTVSKKMTFIEAAQLILKQNDNTPMSANEIWEQIEDLDLVKTKSVNPSHTLNANILAYSDNSNVSKKYKNKLFHVVSTNPAMFILINPENEIQPDSEDDEFDLESPTKTSAFTLPEEDDVLLGDILPFTHFRGVQSQEEREKVKSTEPIEPVDNPFRQSVCILGKSGRGKSTTIDNMLESYSNMKYDFIIPTASTTGLLAQFSPTSGKTGGGGYIPSRLGKMIMDARNNPKILYTAVFDECHKASIIEMINDELLQCISTERNKGNRFISLDTETESLFSGLKDYRGNLLLPDNFGFIFLSSKPDVITSNDDFFRRVNIYILKKVDDYDSIDYLDMVRETGKDKNGKPTYRLNEEYFIFVEGKSKEDIQQIEKLNDEE